MIIAKWRDCQKVKNVICFIVVSKPYGLPPWKETRVCAATKSSIVRGLTDLIIISASEIFKMQYVKTC